MKKTENKNTVQPDDIKIRQYYRLHSKIYDATRWSFLFGRNRLLSLLPDLPTQPRILEVGCGTGRNINRMRDRYPNAKIVGIDLSPAMLKVAAAKVGDSPNIKLLNVKYGAGKLTLKPFDLVLFSYSLSMFNSEIEETFDQLSADLTSQGFIAVVDFHTTPFTWFKRWMKINHVELNGGLLPLLSTCYDPVTSKIKQAYLGMWSYFLFMGRMK